MKNYVYICKDCLKDVELYDLEQSINKIKNMIEHHHYFSHFEVFEYPYYVRKNIAHRYRLLVRLNEYSDEQLGHYKVYVFLKVYTRGGKEYENLFINAKSYGDVIYSQCGIKNELEEFIVTLGQQPITVNQQSCTEVRLFIQQCGFDFLGLNRETVEMQYFTEPRQWGYATIPYLNEYKKQQIYFTLLNTLSTDSYQHTHVLHQPLTIDMPFSCDEYLSRDYPVDALLDQEIWMLCQRLKLPLYLNRIQRKITEYFFDTVQANPLCIDATSNTGKSSILALLFANTLATSSHLEQMNPLFLVKKNEKVFFQEQLNIYFTVLAEIYGIYPISVDVKHYIDQNCVDLVDLIQPVLDPKIRKSFCLTLYVTEFRFIWLWQKHLMSTKVTVSAQLSWFVIQHLIKGRIDSDADIFDYADQKISADVLQIIVEKVWQAWYFPLCQSQGYWDDQDLTVQAMACKLRLPPCHGLFVDQAHQYSPLCLQFLMQSCAGLTAEVCEQVTQLPVVFFGNQQYSFFDWTQRLSQQLYLHYQLIPRVEHIVDEETHIEHIHFYFVDELSEQERLLTQPSMTWLMNSCMKDGLKRLKNGCLSQFFNMVAVEQIGLNLYYLDNLPNKVADLVLLDFSPSQIDLEQIKQLSDLSMLRVFIVSDIDDFCLWQQHFTQLNVHLETTKQAVLQDLSIDLSKINWSDALGCLDYARAYENQHQYTMAWQLYSHSYFLQERYVDYFQLAQHDQQRAYMVEKLWLEQMPHILWNVRSYIPHDYKYHLAAIEHCFYAQEKSLQVDTLSHILEQYLAQNMTKWAVYWQVLLPQLFAHIRILNTQTTFVWWSKVLLHIEHIQDTFYLKAVCAYNAHQYALAKVYWEQAYLQQEITQFPQVYQNIELNTIHDIEIQVLAYIKLKRTDKLMTLLVENTLNELQQSYWDKICIYLDEHDELKSVLNQLLIHINHPVLLDRLYEFCKNNNDTFSYSRIQRFKTLYACLNSDWDVVIERIEHYMPTQYTVQDMTSKLHIGFGTQCFSHSRSKQNRTVKKKQNSALNNELVDILYALSLNNDLKTCITAEEFAEYQAQPQIVKVFDALRGVFSSEYSGSTVWNYHFPAVRALTGLLEKSPSLADAFGVYTQILSRDIKDTLHKWCLERIAVVIERLKMTSIETSEICNEIRKLELKYKKRLKVDLQTPVELKPIKNEEELLKNILELTQQELCDIQQVKKAKQQVEQAKLLEQQRIQALEDEQRQAEERLKQQEIAQAKLLEQQRIQALEDEQRQAEERLKQQEIAQAKLLEQQRIQALEDEQRQAEERLKQQEIAQAKLLEQQRIQALEDEQRQAEEQLKQQEIAQAKLLAQSMPSDMQVQSVCLEETQLLTKKAEFNSRQKSLCDVIDARSHELVYHATTEMELFGLCIFLSRRHKRLNLESLESGLRYSIQTNTKKVSSDWSYTQEKNTYYIAVLQITIELHQENIMIQQHVHGVSLTLHL
ncbi:hypothetical protein I2F17_02235 [Acinetobacter sp. B10A]|uniref:hypothetical protein n=1 Tax=Acinetobacter baretiae TaxID=2605383 RepID=UPI001B3C829D|nr:hypothetical protein [Acinetobacter baretiae]MBF7684653.1 hypothetical protein [Acinetobacter baretiae]